MASQSSFLRTESSKPSTTAGRHHLSCHRKPYFHCTGVSKVFLASTVSISLRDIYCAYYPLKPTPMFLPGESHGQRSLAGCSPWGHKNRTQLSTKPPWPWPTGTKNHKEMELPENPSCSLTPDSNVYSNNSSKAFNAFKNSSSAILKNCFFWNFFFPSITQAMYLGSHDWVRLVWWEDFFFLVYFCGLFLFGWLWEEHLTWDPAS